MKKILSLIILFAFASFAYSGITKASPDASVLPLAADISSAARGASHNNPPEVGRSEPILMVGIHDVVLTQHTIDFLKTRGIGGVLLLSRNIATPSQLRKLTSDIHAIDPDIIIAIDQEGGVVSRIPFAGLPASSQRDIASESDAYVTAYKRAQELKELGIDMNFSPVADYITDPDSFLYTRTFQGNPEKIAVLAGAMLRGYEDGGVIPVLKHFPGHTNGSFDTHDAVTTVSATREELAAHIEPFQKIIERFRVPAVMVGGSIYAAYDSVPAALSRTVVSDILKKNIGFDGLIISDDLEMDAFSQFTLEQRARRAKEAGVDILIFSQTKTTEDALRKAFDQL